jgi:putative ABC transport system substrate-binding protein
MSRREFFGFVGGAAVVLPLGARGQQLSMPIIGCLSATTETGFANRLAAFRDGLKEGGFIEGQNVAVEYRWADDHNERLPELATDLAKRQVTVIVVTGGTAGALAAKAATSTIPIVFALGADPIRAGLVTSLSRPGGNVTGIASFTDVLIAKRLELLIEVVPSAATFGGLLNGSNPNSQNRSRDLEKAARDLRREMRILDVSSSDEFETAFATAVQERIGGLVVQNDTLFIGNADQLAALGTRFQLPTAFEAREHVEVGGFISYGPNSRDRMRLLGLLTSRILKGERPSDLPVQEPTKFELIINLKTAKAIGLTIPPALLSRADEVIE